MKQSKARQGTGKETVQRRREEQSRARQGKARQGEAKVDRSEKGRVKKVGRHGKEIFPYIYCPQNLPQPEQVVVIKNNW